jgi:hypothetical protein
MTEQTNEQITLPEDHFLNNYDDLGKDPAAIKNLGKYTTEAESHKGHLELIKKFGKSVRMPESLDALDDQGKTDFWASVAKLSGVPEKAEDYQVTRPENMPEGLPYNEALEAAAKRIAKESNLPPAVLDKFVEAWNQEQIKAFIEAKGKREDARKKAIGFLQAEYAADYKSNLELVRRLIQHPDYVHSDEDAAVLDDYLRESNVGNNIPLIRLLVNIARQLVGTGAVAPGEKLKQETLQQTLKDEYPKSYDILAP